MASENERKPILLTEGVPQLFRDLIHERTGIFFDADRLDMLLDRLLPLAQKQNVYSYLDYYYLLKYEENNQKHWAEVMDAISVPETYFWREFSQIEYLVNDFVPKWFGKGKGPLRVWSAACASGEEVYSIIMALMEAGWGEHPIEVMGSDSSIAAINKAKRPVFREKAFRILPLHLKEKYFTKVENEWELSPEVAKRATFSRVNLLAPEEAGLLARAPVIFCRNVFIYFSPHAIRQTVALFASRMPRTGHLFVGSAESLLRLTSDFELRQIGDVFVYVRI